MEEEEEEYPFTHQILFVYLRQCTSYNLSCKVSFLCTSWMAEINRVAIKFCFKAQSIWDRNISIGAKGLWE
jgi:hypothetical protein